MLNISLVWKAVQYQKGGHGVNKLERELFLYGGKLKAWQEAHPELMGEKKMINSYKSKPLKLANKQLNLAKFDEFEENYDVKELNYQKFSLRDNRPFSWELMKNKSLNLKQLPFKLYNIKTKKIEETEGRMGRYAILSYVWGNPNEGKNKLSEEQKKELDNTTADAGYKNSDLLTRLGYKSWKKAIGTCKLLGIDHLWIDQLCIDQKNIDEKNQEVPKMGKYYGQAEATLISINMGTEEEKEKKELALEILKRITSSQWFSRSWTFQEGWLSKQTLFMFDDALVDGRLLAQIWANYRPTLNDSSNLFNFNLFGGSGGGLDFHNLLMHQMIPFALEREMGTTEPEKFSTPIGWTYWRNVHNF